MKHLLLQLTAFIEGNVSRVAVKDFIRTHPEPGDVGVLVDACKQWGIAHELGAIPVEELHLAPRYSVLLFPLFEDCLLLLGVEEGIAIVQHQEKGEMRLQVQSLQAHWTGSILLIDKDSPHTLPTGNPSLIQKPTFWLLAVALLLVALQLYAWGRIGALLLPVLGGMYCSVAAYFTGLGIRTGIAAQVCASGAKKNACTTVLQSPVAKVLGIPLSLAGLFYFGMHAMLLLTALSSPAQKSILQLDALLWYAALPVVIYSLAYQYFRLRSWCRLCLLIVTMLLLGMGLSMVVAPKELVPVAASLPYLSWTGVLCIMALLFITADSLARHWVVLKQAQRNYHHFLYDPDAVQARLSKSSRLDYFPEVLSLPGNSDLHPTQLLLSLHCSHCKRQYEELLPLCTGQQAPGMVVVLLPPQGAEEQEQVFLAIASAQDWAERLHYWYSSMQVHNAEKRFLKRYPVEQVDKEKGEQILSIFRDFAASHKINSAPRRYIQGLPIPAGEPVQALVWYREAISFTMEV